MGTHYVCDPLANEASLEKDYSRVLEPALRCLCSHPGIPFTLYISGDAVAWLEHRHSEFFVIAKELISKKKLEILGGGYFAPFFPFIPPAYRVMQIEMLTTALRKKFEKRPRGAWLPSSAWEPSMISSFVTCGIEYVLIDRRMLKYSGFPGVDGNSPVSIEENGRTITALPLDNTLETALLGERSVQDFCSAVFHSLGDAETGGFAFFIPPDIIPEVFSGDDPWIHRFCDFIDREGVPISLETASQIVKKRRGVQRWMSLSSGMSPRDIVVSPEGYDYPALSKIPVKQNILTSFPGAFNVYSKMMYVHTLAGQIHGDKSRKALAMEELCHAQNHLLFSQTEPSKCAGARSYLYKKLLFAEKMTRQKGFFSDSLVSFDYDFDSLKEYLSQTEGQNMYVHLFGGKIFEFDVFSAGKNFCDFTPLEGKRPDCGGGLFIDYFVRRERLPGILESGAAALPKVFSANFYQEAGFDSSRFELTLKTSGNYGDFDQPISLKKQYAFKKNGVQVQFILKNESPFNLSGVFVEELDVILSGKKKRAPSVSVFSGERKQDGSPGGFQFDKAEWIVIYDSENQATFKIEANETPGLITRATPYTDSTDVSSPKILSVFLHWQVDLSPGYETEKTVFLTVES